MADQRRESDQRPSPDALLAKAKKEESRAGRLKIFLGAAPGVGKTYEMLQEARARAKEGEDVVVGVVETHGRKETEALLDGLEVIPRRRHRIQGSCARGDGPRRAPRAPPATWPWSMSSPIPMSPAAGIPSAISMSRSC